MTTRSLGDPAVEALRSLDLAIEHLRAQLARANGVTVADTLILSELAHAADGTLRPRDIAARLDLGTGTLTAMLDRLEATGLVSRLPNPGDRRSTLIRLDARGRRALTRYSGVLDDAVGFALGDAQRAAFAAQVQAVADRIVAAGAEAS